MLGILGLMAGSLAVYLWLRTQTVGGCDSWSYLSQSMSMRGAGLDMTRPLDPNAFPALVPLCHALHDGQVVSFFPPGYPALLAAAGLFGWEFFVNPVLGAVSVGLLYALLLRRTGRTVALAVAGLWATSPMVMWGAIRLMSDLPATVFLMASLLLLEHRRQSSAGALLGLSLGVRPSNLLFGLAVTPEVLRQRRGRRFFGGLAAGGLLWATYLWVTLGLPWEAPYAQVNASMVGPHRAYLQQAGFLLTTCTALHPAIVVLALVALVRRAPGSLTLGLWFAAFVAFYAGWRAEYDVWWQSRFVLPGTAALHGLGGLGIADLRKSPTWLRWTDGPGGRTVAGVLLALLGGYHIWFAEGHGVFELDFEGRYAVDSRRVASLTSEQSIVAASNFSGPLRLYGHRASFQWNDPGAAALVEHALAEPRPVYAVIEPWSIADHEALQWQRSRYELVEIARLTLWAELRLHRLLPRPLPVDDDPEPAVALTLVDHHGVIGEAAVVVDGYRPRAGTRWNSEGAVVLADLDASITVAGPDGAQIDSLLVNADGNDAYVIEGSRDGVVFEPLVTVDNPHLYGLRERRVDLRAARPMRYLRLTPGDGDGAFSIAELVAFGGPPRATVVEATGIEHGDPARLVDRVTPPEGYPWDGDQSVVLAADAAITLRLPSGWVTGVRVNADGNDSYGLQGSADGVHFHPLAPIPAVPGDGMRTRTLALQDGWSWLRVTPIEGDGLFSLGEVTPEVARGATIVDLSSVVSDTDAGDWTEGHDAGGRVFLRPVGRSASLPVPLTPGTTYRVVLTVPHSPEVPEDASMTLRWNGVELERHRLNRSSHTYHLVIPARLVGERNTLRFEFDRLAAEPGGGVGVARVMFERAVGSLRPDLPR